MIHANLVSIHSGTVLLFQPTTQRKKHSIFFRCNIPGCQGSLVCLFSHKESALRCFQSNQRRMGSKVCFVKLDAKIRIWVSQGPTPPLPHPNETPHQLFIQLNLTFNLTAYQSRELALTTPGRTNTENDDYTVWNKLWAIQKQHFPRGKSTLGG